MTPDNPSTASTGQVPFEEQLLPSDFVETYIAGLQLGGLTPLERTLVCPHLRLFVHAVRDQIHDVCEQMVKDFDLSVKRALAKAKIP